MHIAFVVNDLKTEMADYTTAHLALTTVNQGHTVYYINVGDFVISLDNHISAHAVVLPKTHHRLSSIFLEEIQKLSESELINVDKFDVLMLRNDPAQDAITRPWARMAAINFGCLTLQYGVLVLNDPNGLQRTFTKLYLKALPHWVYPRTIITRHKEDIKSFIENEGGYAILKPLFSSGGKGVFVVQPHDEPNINQMIEAIGRDGYVIAQEYLHEAVKGDTRLFVMNGEPLLYKGRIAAIHRRREEGDLDIRSNISAGATAVKAEVTDQMIELVKAVKPFLIKNGIFFAGLDIVDNKLLEINVMSPGGLDSACRFENVNYFTKMIDAIQDKLDYIKLHPNNLDNNALSTLVP